ncbi:MAG: glycoside hydrolase family 31 protein, partial [Anaerolineaceae bacterium]|nr:glycoside hydrolase family 31 protein [Anaerolineaceae bacterium]
AQENGFIVKQADGSPYQVIPLWFHGSAVIDFTNPNAAAWWLNKRKYLVTEMGVDGFKTDGGEHIWARDARFFDGKTGSDHINSYPLLYIGAYDRFMREHRGDDFTLFSRAGYTGLQQFPSQWAGDENSTWAAYRASIYAMLNAGLCGLPFIGWDIAGFTGAPPSAELYLRAAAMSVFCPIMQYHSEDNALRIPRHDRTPWHIQEISGDKDVIPLFSKFANIRMNLMPYLLSQAWLASRSGIPMMRALALEYPQDATCRKYPLEYCFGDALLVAPITEEGASTWPVYLPEGVWRDLWTGKIYYGPSELNVTAPRDRVPVYQKKGSLLALNLNGSGELGGYVGNKTENFKNLTLRIFPGGKFESPIFLSADTEPVWVTVECQKTDGLLVVDLPVLPQCVDLVIAGLEPLSVTRDGQPLPHLSADSGTDAGWQWDADRHEIRVHLPENSHSSKIVIE